MPYRPLDYWGTHMWGVIHTICVVDYEDPNTNKMYVDKAVKNLKALQEAIPCIQCRGHYEKWMHDLQKRNVYEHLALFRWSVDFHNEVNARTGKTAWTFEEALAKWSKQI